MSKIVIKMYGVESRRDMIDATAKKLSIPEEYIYLDDRSNGGDSLYTAKKAYLSEHGDATHGIFLQDDIEVCNNFIEICERIIETHPDKIVSLFPFDYRKKDLRLEGLSSPYLAVKTLSACGIIMPIGYIKPCFEYIKKYYNDEIADDMGISSWARNSGVKMITTIPSLIQHIGDVSLIDRNASIRRTFYYETDPVADWSNTKVSMPINWYEQFAPKCPNVIKAGR